MFIFILYNLNPALVSYVINIQLSFICLALFIIMLLHYLVGGLLLRFLLRSCFGAQFKAPPNFLFTFVAIGNGSLMCHLLPAL